MVQARMTHQAVVDHFNVSRITISRLMIRLRQTDRTNEITRNGRPRVTSQRQDKMVILDTLKWSTTAWWVIPAWTIPTARSRPFWRSRGIDVLKIQIFRTSQQKKRYKNISLKYMFMLKPKQLFIIIYFNVCVKRIYPHKANNNILFRSRPFWRSRGIDVLKIQIFRMENCLLLLTAQ
jgi:hypothetical protein